MMLSEKLGAGKPDSLSGCVYQEITQLAAHAPDRAVLPTCEDAVLAGGRDLLAAVLRDSLQGRIDLAEKKGRFSDAAPVAEPSPIAAPNPARS